MSYRAEGFRQRAASVAGRRNARRRRVKIRTRTQRNAPHRRRRRGTATRTQRPCVLLTGICRVTRAGYLARFRVRRGGGAPPCERLMNDRREPARPRQDTETSRRWTTTTDDSGTTNGTSFSLSLSASGNVPPVISLTDSAQKARRERRGFTTDNATRDTMACGRFGDKPPPPTVVQTSMVSNNFGNRCLDDSRVRLRLELGIVGLGLG